MSEIKLSIVTIAYNAVNQGLEKTLSNIIGEKKKFNNIEYIVIDGKSTDDSSSIYNKYKDGFDVFVSEDDFGISDAFNKGVKYSKGKYVWFVNAGDFISENILDDVLSFLDENSEYIIYGNMNWISSDGNISLLTPDSNYEEKIYYSMPFLHPSTIVPRSIFNTVGLFDCRLKRAMDYDLVLRAFIYGYRAKKVNLCLSSMIAGGVHDRDYIKTLLEVFKVSIFSGSNIITAIKYLIYTYYCQKIKKV